MPKRQKTPQSRPRRKVRRIAQSEEVENSTTVGSTSVVDGSDSENDYSVDEPVSDESEVASQNSQKGRAVRRNGKQRSQGSSQTNSQRSSRNSVSNHSGRATRHKRQYQRGKRIPNDFIVEDRIAEGRTNSNYNEEEEEDDDDGDDYHDQNFSKQCSDISVQERENLISSFMRYALFMDAKKQPIKREEINRLVLTPKYTKQKNLFNFILSEANVRMKEIFGYEILKVEKSQQGQGNSNNSKAKYWILRMTDNPTPSVQLSAKDLQERTSSILSGQNRSSAELGLLMVIVGLIRAYEWTLDEEALWESLQKLGINKTDTHSVFGDTQKLIDKFVRQMYIEKRRESIGTSSQSSSQQQDPTKQSFVYVIGPRIKAESDTDQIVQFISRNPNRKN